MAPASASRATVSAVTSLLTLARTSGVSVVTRCIPEPTPAAAPYTVTWSRNTVIEAAALPAASRSNAPVRWGRSPGSISPTVDNGRGMAVDVVVGAANLGGDTVFAVGRCVVGGDTVVADRRSVMGVAVVVVVVVVVVVERTVVGVAASVVPVVLMMIVDAGSMVVVEGAAATGATAAEVATASSARAALQPAAMTSNVTSGTPRTHPRQRRAR